MKQHTVQAYTALQAAMAEAYGVGDVTRNFAVSIPMETRLNDAIQASSDFLQRINIIPVTDKIGQALNMVISSTLARRTDTSGTGERKPKDASGPDGMKYTCVKTEFDVAITYALLDAWARFPNFQERYMQHVYRRIALDRILIGWHGTSAATNTDDAANPNLEDVNIGWLKLLEDNNAENFLTESGSTASKITLGAGGDYKNLDALAYDIYSMIGDAHRTGNEVAVVGRGLVADDMGKVLTSHAQQPTEKNHIQIMEKSYGGLPTLTVPGFPDTGLVVTDLENLSIYWQEGSMRRKSEDNARRDRVEDFNSSNEAYVIEDTKGIAGIKAGNVQFAEA